MSEAVITTRKLSLIAGRRALVRALDWTVRPGERWAVLGPNGAGKSTLLAVLAGVRAADEGEVLIDDRPLSAWSIEALAQRRALVADRWLDAFSASVLDTVLTARFRFGAQDADALARARDALARLDCAELAERDVRSLSRGERQRVSIATALVQDTPLLLLDEPTAHQDPRHQTLVLQRLADATYQGQAHTLVLTLHDVNAAARCATHALLLSGDGFWQAGRVEAVLTTSALQQVFGVAFETATTPAGVLFYPGGPT